MYEFLRKLFFLPFAANALARSVDRLHFFVIGTTLVGSVAIACVTAWFIWRYHASVPRPTAHREVSRRAEAALVTVILVAFIGWWLIGYRQYLNLYRPVAGSFLVYVTAKQWMWKFTYPDGHSTNDVLTLPEDSPVTLVMTSRDVVHSFYVPGFRAKQDVIPGRYVTLSLGPPRAGTYPIWCAEYCGVSHYAMHGTVRVLPVAEFRAWLEAGAPDEGSSLGQQGRLAAARHGCFACHTEDGQIHIAPTFQNLFGSEVPLADGTRVLADAAYLTRSMMDPNVDVVAGFQPVMPSYLGQLSPADTAAIVEYIRSLRYADRAPNPKLPVVRPVPDGGAPESGP